MAGLYHINAKFGCGGIIVKGGRIVRYPPIFSALKHSSIKELVRYYTVTKISDERDWDNIERPCWNCFEQMEPTEETFALSRIFKCPKCGARFLWLDKPTPNRTHAWKHYSEELGGHSLASMMNDPECDVCRNPPKYPPPPGLGEPTRKRIDGKSFRWHKGRERWVLWE